MNIGKYTLRDKYGYPIESVKGKFIKNIIRATTLVNWRKTISYTDKTRKGCDCNTTCNSYIEKQKPCAWCKSEYTIIDDDFGQPISSRLITHCFHCGRKLGEKE